MTHLILMSHNYITDYDNKFLRKSLKRKLNLRLLIGQRVCFQNFRRTRSQGVA